MAGFEPPTSVESEETWHLVTPKFIFDSDTWLITLSSNFKDDLADHDDVCL